MKILHIVHTPRHSGAERLVASLCEIHRQGGHACEVISLNESEENFLPVIEAQACIGVQWVQLPTQMNKIRKIIKLRQHLKQYGADLILGHSVIPAAYARITGAFDVIPVLHDASQDDYKYPKLAAMEKILQFRTKRVVTVSELGAKNYRRRYSHPATLVIKNGIDLKKFSRPNLQKNWDEIRNEVRDELKISQSAKIIIQVGRLTEDKGQLETIQALHKISDVHPNAVAILVGIPENQFYHAQLIRVIRELGLEDRMHILGARSDIPKLLLASDVYVMPSKIEAHSVALLEALKTGIPAVLAAIPPFAFASAMTATQMIIPADVSSYAKAIAAALSQPFALDRNLDPYDIKISAAKYLELGCEDTQI